MNDQVVVVKARTQAGMIQEFRCLEILEINGVPYTSSDQSELDMQAVQGMFMSLEGRLIALENILGRGLTDDNG